MEKRRVLLVCSQDLFGAGMESMLRAESEVELIGPWGLGEEVCPRITEASLDVVLIVDDDSKSQASANLTASILEGHPNVSVIRAGLNENVFRVFSTHSHPAHGSDLLETIRNLPETKNPSNERSE